ncbi:L-threonylcarbamoyladenylate synthase [Streptococcus rupicaprae]|uniref:L-threonylcarbamoyladenylate synthase n=1 Tax=Streptococcus rupicaprae TaxID=759619 RepID=A0ABV2FFL5_9STRE
MNTSELSSILALGGAVVLPTETVYGLFAKALDEQAVNQVYALKNRPLDKAMNLNVSSLDDILAYSQNQPNYLEKLYQSFFPGPLTIILQANDRVPAWINSGLQTVGFRLPAHSVTQDLISQHGPLIGPSANVSGSTSGTKFEQILADFDGQVTGYADDQALTGQDSTILDLSGDRTKILRQGAITKEDLLAVVPELRFEED